MDPLARLEAEIKNLSSGPELLSQLKSFRAANASGFPALCRSIHGVVKEAFGVNVAQSVPRSGEEALKGATHVLRGLSFFSPRGKGDVGFFPNKLVVVPQKGGQVFEMFGPGATDSSADADIATVGIFENLPDAVNANKLFVFIRLAPTAEVFQELKSRRKRVTSIVLQVSGDQQLGPMPHPSGQAEIGRGPAAMVLAQALGSYGVRDWAAPNADDFLSASNHAAAAAYIKASRGWLIPLKSALCFLGSPCLYLSSASISHVEFLRANGHSQTFDLLVHCRDSGDGAPSDGRSTMHEFSNIDRTEAGPLKQYVAALRIPEGEAADSPTAAPSGSGRDDGDGASDDDDEEDDEDYDPDQPLPKRMRNADEAGPSTSAGFIASELGSEDMLDEDGEEEEEEEGSDAELVDEDDLSVGQLQALIQRQPSAG